jgi:hypothetical protein
MEYQCCGVTLFVHVLERMQVLKCWYSLVHDFISLNAVLLIFVFDKSKTLHTKYMWCLHYV